MSGYEVDIRPMVWRVETGEHYALIVATTAAMAANKARALERKGQLSSDFGNPTRVSGPWERNQRHVIAG